MPEMYSMQSDTDVACMCAPRMLTFTTLQLEAVDVVVLVPLHPDEGLVVVCCQHVKCAE